MANVLLLCDAVCVWLRTSYFNWSVWPLSIGAEQIDALSLISRAIDILFVFFHYFKRKIFKRWKQWRENKSGANSWMRWVACKCVCVCICLNLCVNSKMQKTVCIFISYSVRLVFSSLLLFIRFAFCLIARWLCVFLGRKQQRPLIACSMVQVCEHKSCCCCCVEWASIYLHDNLNCLLMLFSPIWIDRSYANNNKSGDDEATAAVAAAAAAQRTI